jgi:Zn-dependent peptidase ImmA (M78 family)
MPSVNPEILIWARETASLSIEEAAHAIGLNDARGVTGPERLAALEAGEVQPSRAILLNMAQKYRRPLLIFYLHAPPRRGDRGRDFRTIPGAQPPSYDPALDALIRNIKSRQSVIRSLLEDEETEPLAFIGSAEMKDGTVALVEQITDTLAFRLSDFRSQRTIEDAFAYLRSYIERAGIFVILAGNLGSHHSNISADIFRGFAIADSIAPFIVINDQDALAAWSFTALHETTHLWLGMTGVSGASISMDIERFCNDVAGEILLPESELQEIAFIHTRSVEEAVTHISEFARARKISRSMVAYKLFRSNMINENRWREFNSQFQQVWQETRKRKDKDKKDGRGPDFYVVRRHRLGKALIELMRRSLAEGAITHTKAGQALGVKPRNIEKLLHGTSSQGGA